MEVCLPSHTIRRRSFFVLLTGLLGALLLKIVAWPLLVPAALLLAACGSSTATPTSSVDASCAKEKLAVKTAGKLTLSTDNPAYSPWFQGGNEGATVWTGDYNNDPAKGQGYEGAVAYAVAAKLGFTADEVVWIHTTFDASFAPGAKD